MKISYSLFELVLSARGALVRDVCIPVPKRKSASQQAISMDKWATGIMAGETANGARLERFATGYNLARANAFFLWTWPCAPSNDTEMKMPHFNIDGRPKKKEIIFPFHIIFLSSASIFHIHIRNADFISFFRGGLAY